MGEGTHTPSVAPQGDTQKQQTTNKQLRSNQWKYLIAGTAGALLIAGAVFQVYRTRGLNADDGTGRASLNGPNTSASKSLARVGDSVITYQAVADEAVARKGKEILDKMINRLIIQQACRKKGISITRAEVDAEVLKIAKKFNLDPTNWYQMLMAERNLTKLQYQRDIIWPMLALKKLAGSNIQPTQEDIKKAFIHDYGVRVRVRMIMMDNHRDMQTVHNEAVEAQKAGATEALKTFKQLAQRYSIEPTSRVLGGQVPPIQKYSGGGNIEDAAFELKAGQLSQIVQVGARGTARYVILYCEGHTTPHVTDIKEVYDILVTQIKEEKIQESVAKTFETLKKNTEVQNYLTGTTSGGIKQTSFNTGTRTSAASQSKYQRPQPRRTTQR